MERRKSGLIFAAAMFCLLGLAYSLYGDEKSSTKTLDTDPNLAGWWTFDEGADKTTPDSSKHKRNGALKGGLSFDKNSAEGKVGKALKFDGRDNYVEITKYKGVGGTRPRTIAAWFKTKKTQGEIISWGTDEPGQMWTLGFIRGRLGVTPNGGYLYMNAETHDDKWHHVAVVVEPAELPNLHDNVKLYKDGSRAEIHDIGLLDLWPIETGAELDVTIGRKFEGLIDDVRIYNRALPEEQINLLFKLQNNRPLSDTTDKK